MLSFLGQCAVCGQLCRHTGRAGRDRLQSEATLCIKDDGGLLSVLSWIYSILYSLVYTDPKQSRLCFLTKFGTLFLIHETGRTRGKGGRGFFRFWK